MTRRNTALSDARSYLRSVVRLGAPCTKDDTETYSKVQPDPVRLAGAAPLLRTQIALRPERDALARGSDARHGDSMPQPGFRSINSLPLPGESLLRIRKT
jgi:hypothetical protein